MNTQTHLLLASVILGRRATRREQAAILGGAVLPDLSIFALAGWSMIGGVPQAEVWDTVYWSGPWQLASMVSNSVPLWLGVLGAGLVSRKRWLILLAGAGLLHLAGDFPVHAEDAHAHLWPVSEWRFRSPVSYWDPAHHGRIVSVLEAALGLGLVTTLWRRHRRAWIRGLLTLCALAYAAVPLFWLSQLS